MTGYYVLDEETVPSFKSFDMGITEGTAIAIVANHEGRVYYAGHVTVTRGEPQTLGFIDMLYEDETYMVVPKQNMDLLRRAAGMANEPDDNKPRNRAERRAGRRLDNDRRQGQGGYARPQSGR